MNVAIKLNPAERIRRLIAAEPNLGDDVIKRRLGVTAGQIKAAMAYKGLQNIGRRQA